jgi:dipeptidase
MAATKQKSAKRSNPKSSKVSSKASKSKAKKRTVKKKASTKKPVETKSKVKPETKPQETTMSEENEVVEETESTEENGAKRGRKPVPEDESRENRFQRLATSRVNKALKAIQLIGNLAQKNNYGYTDKQVLKIRDALEHTVASTMEKFSMADPANESKFEL